jgi:Rieske Fe-S protein
MTSRNPKKSNIGRRRFLRMAGAGLAAASAGTAAPQASASTQPPDSETSQGIVRQPPQFAQDLTTADI